MLEKFHKKIGILKFLTISFFVKMISAYVKEFNNYFFFKRRIRDAFDKGVLNRHNIDVSKGYNEMYYVINMKPELLSLSKPELEQHEKMIVSNEIVKLENILSEYQLYDLLKFSYDRIYTDRYYAYGITCTFNFRQINMKNNKYLLTYFLFLLAAFVVLYSIF